MSNNTICLIQFKCDTLENLFIERQFKILYFYAIIQLYIFLLVTFFEKCAQFCVYGRHL